MWVVSAVAKCHGGLTLWSHLHYVSRESPTRSDPGTILTYIGVVGSVDLDPRLDFSVHQHAEKWAAIRHKKKPRHASVTGENLRVRYTFRKRSVWYRTVHSSLRETSATSSVDVNRFLNNFDLLQSYKDCCDHALAEAPTGRGEGCERARIGARCRQRSGWERIDIGYWVLDADVQSTSLTKNAAMLTKSRKHRSCLQPCSVMAFRTPVPRQSN